MNHPNLQSLFRIIAAAGILLSLACSLATAQQQQDAPLTSQELVKLVYQLPKEPEKKDAVVEEIRRRGIGFALTDGMRSLVASKSGNDPALKRTLEEAERRRANPVATARPSEAEAQQLLSKTGEATQAASEAMPDFVVKQLIGRSYSYGRTSNWIKSDSLTVAVSYRAEGAEEYKLLAVNGLPPGKEAKDGQSYAEQVGGSTSTGEYVSRLALLFEPQSEAAFKATDTDTLRGRRTIVYEYQIRQDVSHWRIIERERGVTVGYHGRIWVDRELARVLRLEMVAEMPAGFPVSAVTNTIDYDWVTIADQRYLLPSQAESIVASMQGPQLTLFQTRNDTRFRGYQKYGSEVKVIEEDIVEDPPEQKP
ncbi:MAG: hypothetical protein JO360_16620 [Acidobacteria bacterium]|nr:hypothetical protein [Acidobacteriota bacterium]